MPASEIIKRILLLLVVSAIQAIYIPTSLGLSGGIAPKLPWDVFPIWQVWVIPYLLCFPMWLAASLWAVWKMDANFFNAMIIACALTFSVSITIFLAFPTYVERSPLSGNDLFTQLLLWVYEAGGNYDALPSGHIYITSLLVFFYNLWKPRLRLVWFGILMMVSFATLFTGQHYILDLLAGYFIAWIGYRFGLWKVGLMAEKLDTRSGSTPPG